MLQLCFDLFFMPLIFSLNLPIGKFQAIYKEQLMFHVLGFSISFDQDAIYGDDNTKIEELSEGFVHDDVKNGRRFYKTIWHHKIFIVTCITNVGGFPFINLSDAYEVIANLW